MSIEHKLEKLANEALAIHNQTSMNLTDSVREIMKKYALNQHETSRVCERVNHLKFNSEFAMDKTATFEIANINAVIKPDIELAEDVYTFGKVASDNSARVARIKEDVENDAEYEIMKKMAEQASEAVPQLAYEREGLISSIKHELIALTKLGESKDSLYEFVTSITGDKSKMSKEAFDMLMGSIADEGYDMPYAKHASDTNAVVEAKGSYQLGKLLKSYLSKTAEQAKNELNFEYCIQKIAKSEPEEYVDSLSSKVYSDSLVGEAVEFSLIKTGGVLQQFSNWMNGVVDNGDPARGIPAKTRLDLLKRNSKNTVKRGGNIGARVLVGGLMLGGTIKGLGMVQEAEQNYKRKRLKNDLLKAYPDILGDIPYETYSNMYDGLTQLQPHLMRAPYPLAEMIRHQAEYGTIDPKMTMDLLSSWSKSRTNPASLASPYADAGWGPF